LLRLQAELLRCILAELEKQAELMTELGECPELGQRRGGCSVGFHDSDYIVIRHNLPTDAESSPERRNGIL
jgi:hypothetical protein